MAEGQTFHVLGPFSVRHGGTPVDLGSRKQRLLLCSLVLRPNEPVSVDTLVDTLWPSSPPAKPSASLRAYVSNLRKILAVSESAQIVGGDGAYTLRLDESSIDRHRFRVLQADAAQAAQPGERIACLDEALALVTGEPLADMTYEEFAQRHIDSMEEAVLAAREDRADLQTECGRAGAVIPELAELIGSHPTRERLRAIHMRALYAVGRQAEALDSFQQYRQALVEQLGIEPGPALLDLESQILNQSEGLSTARTAVAVDPLVDGPVRAPAELIGRRTQRDAVADVLAAGRGLAVLVGEPGSGKSALLDHAVAAHGDGWRIAGGHCLEEEGAPSLWPWRSILRSLSGGNALAPIAGSDLFDLIDEMTDALLAAAASHPLLLTIEDLHWADTDTLRLLTHLTKRVRRERIVVLATSRTRPSALMAASPVWLDVPPLDAAEVGQLVELRTGLPCDDETAEELRRRTGGNALFVSEIARAAHLAGRDVRADDRIPGHVEDVILARLESFGSDTVEVLRAGSLVAGSFSAAQIAGALDRKESSVIAALDAARAARMVDLDPSEFDRFRFTHAVIRETVASSIDPGRTASLHGALGRSLETLTAGSLAGAADLSRHFSLAVDAGYAADAVRWALVAADRACAMWWFDDGMVHLRRALAAHERLHDPDPRDRCEILLKIVDAARLRLLDEAEADDERYEVYRIAESLGDHDLLGRAALTLTTGTGSTRNQALRAATAVDLQLVERAIEVLPDSETTMRARLISGLAADSYNLKTIEERSQLFEEAAAMAQAVDDPALYARILLQRRVGVGWVWTSEERAAESREILELAVEHTMPDEELLIRQHLIVEALNQSNWDQAQAYFADLQAAAVLRGAVEWRMAVAMWELAFAHMRGDWERAERIVEQATDPHRGFGDELGLRFTMLGSVARSYQGDYSELEGLLRLAVRLTNRRFFPRFLFATLVGGGQWDEARHMLPSLDFLELDGGNIGGQHTAAMCCEPLVRLGALDQLPHMVERLTSIEDQLIIGLIGGGWVATLGTMRYAMARATIALGRFDEAEVHIREGRRQVEPLGARPYLLELDLAEAALVVARDGLAAAAPLLDDVMATAIELGMKGIATQVEEQRSLG